MRVLMMAITRKRSKHMGLIEDTLAAATPAYLPSRDTSKDSSSAPRSWDDAEARKASAAGVTQRDTQVSYNNVTPWHANQGTNTRVVDGTTRDSRQLAIDSGLTWTAQRTQLLLAGGAPVPTHIALTRSDTGALLGLHSKAYQEIQFSEMVAPFDPVMVEGLGTWETAGSLWGGEIVWAQMRFQWRKEVIPGDVVELFATVSNAHNGSRALRFTLSSKRIVCNNTLKISDQEGRTILRARHRKGAIDRTLADAQEWFSGIVAQADEELQAYRKLAQIQLSDAQREAFIMSLVPNPESDKPESPQAQAALERAQGVRDTLHRLSFDGKGVEIEGVLGTAWGALNAVTEYVDHHQFADKDAEKATAGIMFGKGSAMKERALEMLLHSGDYVTA